MIKTQLLKKVCIFSTGSLILASAGFYAQRAFGSDGIEFARAITKWICLCVCAIETLFRFKESNDNKEILCTSFKYLFIYTVALISLDVLTDVFSI